MKANAPKRKVFNDAVDLLTGDMEEQAVQKGIQMLVVKDIKPFYNHPFHLYAGERLEDMVESVREHGSGSVTSMLWSIHFVRCVSSVELSC